MSLAYVGSVYIFPGGRERSEFASVLWRRIAGVIMMTSFAVYNYAPDHREWLTVNPQVIDDVMRALAILHLLYAAPLLAEGGVDLSQYQLPPKATREQKFQKALQVVKNIFVGPITEELVYRGVIRSMYRAAGIPTPNFIWENSLYFALAHIHHAVMRYLDGVCSFKTALAQAGLQFGMTSLFGLYSSLWLVSTGTIWPSIFLHAVCNLYGPPPLSGPKWYFPMLVLGAGFFIYSFKYI